MAVPKLRFKEFDGDWTSNKLKQLTDVLKCGVASTPTYVDEGGYPFLSAQNVSRDGLMDYSKVNNISAEFYKKISKTKLLKGDILYSRVGASYGVASIFDKDEDYGVYVSLTHIRANKDLDNVFLKLFLNSPKARIQAERGVFQGGGVQNLNVGVVEEFELSIPSKPEQTKIASFLSAVDEKISQLTQKHELLSQYKQGMMQKLFSQQIRFKADDGSEFGEWEEKTLIDSVDTNIKWSFTGGPFGSNLKSEDYTELGIRIIQLQNIGDGAFLNDYKIYTSPEKANELLSCNIYPDEILISKMGDPVARCCIVPKHHDRYVMCSDGIRLVVDKKNYSSIFMFYQINYQDFRQSASDVSTGSTRKRIGLSDLKQLPIKVPCLEEQTKIANFLSAIDQKIEVVAQQIEQAKTWKKGLLQQMFV